MFVWWSRGMLLKLVLCRSAGAVSVSPTVFTFEPDLLWTPFAVIHRTTRVLRPLVQALESCPASEALWFSATPPSLRRGRVTTTLSLRASCFVFGHKITIQKKNYFSYLYLLCSIDNGYGCLTCFMSPPQFLSEHIARLL